MSSRPPTVQIVHRPFGLDGPYDALFEERRPRDPVGGDMVVLGFLTRPGGAAATVRVRWRRNGRAQTSILARAAATGRDEDRWLVELGVVEGGDAVEYRIEAVGTGGAVETGWFGFVARRWRRLAGVAGAERVEGGVRLATVGEDGGSGPSLIVGRAAVDGAVRVEIGASVGVESGDRARDGGIDTARSAARGNRIPALSDISPFGTEDGALVVEGDGVRLEVDREDGRLTLDVGGREAIGPLTVRWLEEGDGRVAAVELVGPLADGEALVGFGERFDALDQRGRAPDVAVYEQYKNQGNRTYLPVPFFLSRRGYGLLVEGTGHVAYDLGRTVPDRWRCLAAASPRGVALDLFGGSPREILAAFTALTGRPQAPPAWAFGPWMSSNEWNTQERVLAEVAETERHGIPATVLVIEAWSDETTFYVWNGARYEARGGDWAPSLADFAFPADGPWPDPKGMVERLHAAGIRLLLWQIPALKDAGAPHPQHDADVAHAIERGHVLWEGDEGDEGGEGGRPYRNPAFWFRNALIPDVTSAEATAWWLAKRAYLLDELGVDGFKTDGGEHLQGRGIRASDGRRGDELVNAYPNLYVGAYHRFARERRGGDALTFSRAGHTGAGVFPAHWAGDENSTWEAFRCSIVAGLTAGLSGIPFWGWDLAGFSDDLPSAEFYLRSAAMAAFCPIMQYHSEYNPGGPSRDRTPWNVARHTGDERVIPLYRFFARLRMGLMPYVVREAEHSAATGEPLMRALLLDDPDDPACWRIADQYRFGRDLLVAPVVEEGATTRRLYLPGGRWRDFWAREVELEGGRWIEVAAPLERLPVFVREGAEVARALARD